MFSKLLKIFTIFFGVIFLIVIILSVTTFIIVKHLKIKELVEREIEAELGTKVTIGSLKFSPVLAYVGARDVTIYNPPGFDEQVMAYISSIHIVSDPVDLIIRKKPNIYLFGISLDKLNIVKNRNKEVNIESLPVFKKGSKEADKTPFYFDVIVLSIGEVNYTEYTASGRKEQKFKIGIKNQAFISLKDENEVVKLIVSKAIENTDIAKLINLTIVPVVSNVSETVDYAWGTAKSGAKGIREIVTLPFKLISGK
ncbi:MAG: hypothetical protein ABIH18_04460 [Candidatus Omnitrophota bacterium]